MKQYFSILIAAVTLLAQSSIAADFKRDIPKAGWEPIFFESIDQLTSLAGWTPLRKQPVPPDALEVRIWIGFGRLPLEGYLLRRDGSKWSGWTIGDQRNMKRLKLQQITPKSGWDRFWSRLVSLGLLTLPDSSSLPNEAMFFDGVSYVVEINQNHRYRTYHYGNPKEQKWPEAKKIIEIVQTLSDELAPR
jgi:hypothetical protein